MKRLVLVFAVGVLAACGSSGGDDGDGGRDAGMNVPTNSCGIEGSTQASTCTTFEACRPADNIIRGACDNCPDEAAFEVCDRGACVAYDRSGQVRSGFNVMTVGVGANSYLTMVLDPYTASGTKVTCAALLATCTVTDNKVLNITNSNLASPAGGLQADNNYFGSVSAHVGTDRVVYVIATSDISGNGNIVAHGCTEGVEIKSGPTTDVLIELKPYSR